MSKKIRVAVLYGGRSGEHEVSLMSATNVIQNLDRNKFEVVPIGIDKQGGWFLGDDVLIKQLNEPTTVRLQREAERMLFNPDFIGKAIQPTQIASHLVKQSERLFDVVFPAIHGTLCEDGTVQGLLELADVPYVGCGVLSSAVGMDKDVSKRLMISAGMAIAPFVVIRDGQWSKHAERCRELVNSQLSYPVFVKPANTGSSVGVHKVKRVEDLDAAIQNAFLYDTKIVVEQGIEMRELEVAVLESLDHGADPIVSVVGEIKPVNEHEFYSYAAKYLDENGAELVLPAQLSPEIEAEVKAFAKNAFNVLECEGMARVDLFLEKNTNKIYFNEVNSLPGFTEISMYPKLMAVSGVSYTELLTHLVMLAVERHKRKSRLNREYVAEC